jgi:DNA repair protein RadC
MELLAAVVGGPHQVETAQALLARFGSLHGLARASAADLVSVLGIGPARATRLIAAAEISRRLLQPEEERRPIKSPADAAAILQPLLMHREQEYLYVILLDTRNRVMAEPIEVYHGSLNTSLIRVSEVFRDAVKVNAAAIVVGHNHPSQSPDPSPEDVAVTRAIVEAGKLLDVPLLDHLVIGNPRWVSLKERGLGF